jgi:hypothetical protein
VGPRAGLDAVEKRKFLTLTGLKFRPLGRPARSWDTGYVEINICYPHINALHSSPSIIITMKSRLMRLAVHVARMEEDKECIWDFGGNVRRKEITSKT